MPVVRHSQKYIIVYQIVADLLMVLYRRDESEFGRIRFRICGMQAASVKLYHHVRTSAAARSPVLGLLESFVYRFHTCFG